MRTPPAARHLTKRDRARLVHILSELHLATPAAVPGTPQPTGKSCG